MVAHRTRKCLVPVRVPWALAEAAPARLVSVEESDEFSCAGGSKVTKPTISGGPQ
jgi:hypothetical protein